MKLISSSFGNELRPRYALFWPHGTYVHPFNKFSRPQLQRAHPASYPVDTGGSFRRGKMTGAWGWPLTPLLPTLRMRGAMLGCIHKFPNWIDNTRWETTQMLTGLSHRIAIQLHLVAESYTICSSRSRRPVREFLNTPSYLNSPNSFMALYLIKRWICLHDVVLS